MALAVGLEVAVGRDHRLDALKVPVAGLQHPARAEELRLQEKVDLDLARHRYLRDHDLPAMAVRPGNTLGGTSTRSCLLRWICSSSQSIRRCVPPGDRSARWCCSSMTLRLADQGLLETMEFRDFVSNGAADR